MTMVQTIEQAYGPAMEITDQKEADEYFERLVQEAMLRQPGQTREEAERIQRQNLGYYAGYYDHETRVRVEKLFRCSHPVFAAAKDGPPNVQEIVKKGVREGQEAQ